MVGHPNSDLRSFRRDDLGHFSRRRQDEGVRPRQQPLEQPVRCVVHGHIAGNVGQIDTDQRQRLALGHSLELIQPLHRRFVVEVAPQPIDGIRRVSNDLAVLSYGDKTL